VVASWQQRKITKTSCGFFHQVSVSCTLSLTWILRNFNPIFPFKTSKQKLKRLDAEKTTKTTKEHESSIDTDVRARERTRKQTSSLNVRDDKYFFYIRTSVFKSFDGQDLSWLLSDGTNRHTPERKTPTEGGDKHYFVYISKSAFWHSTVRIRLQISSDGTETHTCKRPPGKCDLVFLLRMYICLLLYLTVKFCRENHRTAQEMPHVFTI
jgi:hypothetical protein